MPDWPPIWMHISELAGRVWASLCHTTHSGINEISLHHDLAAAAIYLGIVGFIALTVVRKSYFHQLQRFHWDMIAANRVWTFTLVIFLFNGIWHGVQKAVPPLPTVILSTPFGKISFATYLLVNVALWLWAITLYNQDVKRRELDRFEIETRRRAFLAYFAPVFALLIPEHELSMYWADLEANDHVGRLLKALNDLEDERIAICVFAFATTISVSIWYREWIVHGLVKILPNFAVRTLRFAVPAAVFLIIGIIIFTYFLGGGSGNAAGSGS
jgi:hypothetical protein